MNKIIQSLVIVLVVSFSLSTFSVPHAEATENSWTTMAAMPTPRAAHGVAVVNGKIYVIGGNKIGIWLSTNEMYDPATNTWTTKTPMPTPRSSFGVAVYQNKIYVIGGALGVYLGYTGVNEVYDPATDTWETKTRMPTSRKGLYAKVVDGKIYLIGGNIGGQYHSVSVNEVYDPATDTWTTKASIPTGVYGYASAVVDNKIYVIGGHDAVLGYETSYNLNQVYDPETDTWAFGNPIPVAAWGVAAGATTGVMAPKRIYIPFNESNYVYDPEKDVWTTSTPMPTPRFGFGVAVVNDVLYAIGGYGDYNYRNENEQYIPFGYGTVPPPDTTPPFPITWIIAATAIIAIVGAAFLVYFAKVKKTIEKAE